MNEILVGVLIAQWVLLIFLGFLTAGALREIGLLQLRLGEDPGGLITRVGLDRGSPAPNFEAVDAATGASRPILDSGRRPAVLLFLTTSCVACRQIARQLEEVRETRPEFDYIAICRGDAIACRELREGAGLRAPMVIDHSGEIQRAYQAKYTPFAYVLSPERRVLVRGLVNNWRQLDALLDQRGYLEPPLSKHAQEVVSMADEGEMQQ